jgi:hypothetical protein
MGLPRDGRPDALHPHAQGLCPDRRKEAGRIRSGAAARGESGGHSAQGRAASPDGGSAAPPRRPVRRRPPEERRGEKEGRGDPGREGVPQGDTAHWFREGQKQRSRILYVFRTPGGVRVGRAPLEPDVLRQLESRHPEIEFDWSVIRDNQQVIEPIVDPRRRRPRREGADAPAPAAVRAPAEPAPPPREEPPPPAVPPSSRPAAIPGVLQGTTPDEQIAFLTEWYPIVRERIPAQTSEPGRQEALLALAERLNPAAWTDADQITSGLQDAAQALERLSRVFSKRRRRARRRTGSPRAATSGPILES